MAVTVYHRRASVIARQVAGSTVLVALGTTTGNIKTRAAELYTLNKAGMMLWELLGEPQTTDAMTTHLADAYGIGVDQARADVQAFLDELVEIRAVEVK